MLKQWITAAALAALAVTAQAQTAQQNKMTSCNAEAKGKKGDERKTFMKTCLKAKSDSKIDARASQREKMKSCNVEAKGKKGDERKSFMKDCLSK